MEIVRSLLSYLTASGGNGRHRARRETPGGRLLARTVAVLCVTAMAGLGLGGAAGGAPATPGDPASIYVTNQTTSTVSVVDPATNAIIATIPVGPGPEGIAVTPDGSKVYVANSFSDTVSVIDTATNTVVATVTVGSGPVGIAVSPDGSQVYVTNSHSGTVSVIDTATDTVINTIPVGFAPQSVVFSPDGATAYVANRDSGTVSVISTATGTVTSTIPVPGGTPRGVVVSPDGSTLYVPDATDTVSVIDTATNTVVKTIAVGSTPTGVAVSADGSTVYVTNYGSNTVSEISTATNTVTATVPGFHNPYGVTEAPPSAPLVITATAHADTSNISTDNGYRVEISNPNPAAAVVQEITVKLPPGFTYTPGTTVGETTNDPVISGNTTSGLMLTWHGPFTVPASGEITIDFDVLVSEVPGTYTIDATATADHAVTPALNTAPITVEPAADLSLTKTASAATVLPGQTFTYDLVAHNAGPSTATTVDITDTLPDGFMFDPATSSAGCSAAGTDVTCAVGSLADGASTPVTIEVSVPGDAAAGIWDNKAVIHSPLFDPDETNNSATASVEVRNSVDLSITKVASPSTVNAGDEVTFTITVSNAGPSTAMAMLEDVLPAGLTPVSITGPGCDATTLTCSMLVPPGTQTVTLVARADDDATGTLINRATVTAPDNVSGTVTAEAPVTVTPSADLAVTKTLVSPLVAGEPAVYQMKVTNNGPSLATGVTLTDTLPAGVTFDTGGSSPECTGPAAGPVTCPVGDLPSGTSVEVTVAVSVPSSLPAGTLLTNTASVAGDQPDPNPANNTSSVTDPVSRVVNLEISKDAPASVPLGGTITYTVTVTNAGPSDASDVVITDPLPSEITPVSAIVTGGTGTCALGPPVTCTFPAVPAGGSAIIQITGTVVAGLGTTITNTADVTSAQSPTPKPAQADTVVEALTGLVVSKMASVNPAVAGSPLTYTVTVTNQGPSPATGVTLHDPLPAGYTATSATASNGASCTTGGGAVVDCADLGPLAALASVTVTITGSVASSASGQLVNTATATDAQGGHADGSSVTSVTQQYTVTITKTVVMSPVAGGSAEWVIEVHNAGPSDASGIVVSEQPGSNFTITSLSGPGCSTASLVCDPVSVPAGATVPITVTATVDPRATGTVENCASGFEATGLPIAQDCSTADVIQRTALVLTKQSVPAAVAAGETVHYPAELVNRGPSTATGIVVTDGLPAGLTFIPAESSDGCAVTSGTPATGQTVTCLVSSLEPGESQDLDIAAVTSTPGVVTDVDTALDNLPATRIVATAVTTIDALSDLSITKTAPPAFAGTDATWTIGVHNAGPSAADGAVVTDTFPAGFTIVSATTDSGTCTHAGQDLTCTLGTIAAGGDATITVVTATAPGLVPPGQTFTEVPNTASVDYPGDTDPDNNTVTFPETLFAKAHVVPVKTVSPSPLTQGGLATYRITVTNQGPSVATGITATDTLPAGLTFVASASDPRCSVAAAGTIRCTAAGPLAPGASTTFTVVAMVSSTLGTGSVIVNDAVASASQYDPDPAEAARAVSVIARPSVPVTG